MNDLTDVEYVKGLQSNLRAALDTPHGVEVLAFLEKICGWYDFSETNPDSILMAHGKRQVLATIKTLLRLPAEQIVLMASESSYE